MPNALRVLLIEESAALETQLLDLLRASGFEPSCKRVASAPELRAGLVPPIWDLVMASDTVRALPVATILALMRDMGIDLPVIVLAETPSATSATEAIRGGASDVVPTAELARLPAIVERELRSASLRRSAEHAEEALRRSQLQLATSQRIAHMGSWEIELDHDSVTWSDEMYRIFGRDPGATAPSRALFEDTIHPDDRAAVLAAREQGRRLNRRFFAEYRALRGDETLWVQERGEPVSSESGTMLRIVGTTQDVTEMKRMQEQLVVSDRMASIGTIAAGVAHEINNPLAAVVANLDLAAQEVAALDGNVRAVAELRDELGDAREAAERLRLIVRDLKVFSRGEDNKREAVDLRRVLESCVRLAWNEIRHRAQVVRDYGETPPVIASESRLGQVFLNLLVNAAQAIPDGRAEHNRIRVATGLDDHGRVFAAVSDTGPGIAPEHLDKIFTPFFTTKARGFGTGLGLSICQHIVADHGGEISVKSEVGSGTTFRVVLPPGDTALAHDLPPAAEGRPRSRRGQILVVDDEPLVTVVTNRVLGAEHDVTAVNGATEALALIASGKRYDIILCDLMMPHMTGIEFYQTLADSVPEQAEAIVFVTGGAFTPRARLFLDRVSNHRLEKPFDARQLRALVNDRVR